MAARRRCKHLYRVQHDVAVAMFPGHVAETQKTCVFCGSRNYHGLNRPKPRRRREPWRTALRFPSWEPAGAFGILSCTLLLLSLSVGARPRRSLADPERWPDRPGNLPPMAGGATVIWTAAVAGNWNVAGNWSTGVVPQAGDAVQIGAGAGATQSNCTLTANTNNLLSLDFTSFTGSFTMTGSFALNFAGQGSGVTGVLTLVSTMTWVDTTSNSINFAQNMRMTTGGKAISSYTWFNTGTFAYTVTMQDAWVACPGGWVLDGGAVDTATHAFTLDSVVANGAATGSIALGSSTITLTHANGVAWGANSFWKVTTALSTIVLSGAGATFQGAGLSYGSISLTGSGTPIITGTNTFDTFSRTGTATKTDSLNFAASQTVGSTFTIHGNSAINKVLCASSTLGTAVTIALSGASVTSTNCYYRDITFTGSPPQTVTLAGDLGGNTGVTTTTPAAQSWVATTGGNWSAVGRWTSRIPLPQDDVTISAAFSAAQTITMDMPYACHNLDFTGVTGSPAFTTTGGPWVLGSITLVAGLGTVTVGTSGFTMASRTAVTLTTNGKTITGGSTNLGFVAVGGSASVSLTDDLTFAASSGVVWFQVGAFDANGHNITAPGFVGGLAGQAWSVNMRSGTFTATGTGANTWNMGTLGTVTAGTSTVVLSDTSATAKSFQGGGYTYNNVSFTGGGTGVVTVTGSNTINGTWAIGAGKTVSLTSGTNTHVGQLTIGTTATINATTAGSAATITQTSGSVSVSHITIKDNTATGGAVFYAGNSTISTNVTGWVTNITASDSWSVNDSAQVSSYYQRSGADSFGMADTATRTSMPVRAAADAFVISDTAVRSAPQQRSGADAFTVADAATRVATSSQRGAIDAFVVSDSATREVTAQQRGAADFFSVVDAVIRAADQNRVGADLFVVSDQALSSTHTGRTGSDGFSINDLALISAVSNRFARDSWSVVDQALRTTHGRVAALDSWTIHDVATAVLHILPYEGMLDVVFVSTKTGVLIPGNLMDAEFLSTTTGLDIVKLLTDATLTQG